MRVRIAALLLLLAAPFALVACGGGSKTSTKETKLTPLAYVRSAAQKTAKAPSSRRTEAPSSSFPPKIRPAKTNTFFAHWAGRSASTSAAAPVRREMATAGVATPTILDPASR